VVRRRSETTCRTPGRFNRTRSGLPERKPGGGFRRIPNRKRRPFRVPGRAATAQFRKGLVRVCPVGVFPVRVRYRFLPSVAPIQKSRRNSTDLAYGPRSRSGGVLLDPAQGFRGFWFPVVGIQWMTTTASYPARVASSDPRLGGSFVGVQPSILGPIGRTVERSPGSRGLFRVSARIV